MSCVASQFDCILLRRGEVFSTLVKIALRPFLAAGGGVGDLEGDAADSLRFLGVRETLFGVLKTWSSLMVQ